MNVAIVGGAPRSKDLAPYDDPEWEVWGLGVHLNPKMDKVFEIHPSWGYETEGYCERLRDVGIPLVVHENFPYKDNAELFPFDEAERLLGQLTSSIAYMMAYAVINGATHIKLYGVDMDVDDKEYFYQRPGLYAWKGYAEGKGIKVEAPDSTLFDDRNYPENIVEVKPPYTENEFRKMADLHQKKIDEYNDQVDQIRRLIDTHGGCKQVYDRLAKIARATDAGIDVQAIDHSTVIRR